MAASPWRMFASAKKGFFNGTIDFDTDTLRMALVKSTWTPNLNTNAAWADISANETTSGNGYTTGGQAITGTVNEASGTTTLSATADSSWTAAGGSVVSRYAVIYKVGAANGITNPLVGYCLLDVTPADITVTDGNTFIVQRPASGFFTMSGGTT